MLLSEFIKKSAADLESLYPGKEATAVVNILCSHFLGTHSYTHIVNPGYEISSSDLHILEHNMEKLLKGEPVQYVTGETEFYGRKFRVTPDVLIPRPETEMMVREAVDFALKLGRRRWAYGRSHIPVRVLDLCTGSGCIAWSLALSVPGVKVTALDISSAALEVARKQGFSGELKGKGAEAPGFMQADILEDVALKGEFDIILSNPPYVRESEKPFMRPNVLEYEPATALFVPDEDPLLFYRAVARWSRALMSSEGMGLVEINEALGEETRRVFDGEGLAAEPVKKDFFNKNRFVIFKKRGL